MELSRISRAEFIAIIGGILLAIGLFLAWYHVGPNNRIGSAGPGETVTGWTVHTYLRWLLLAGAAAPLILAYILLRGHALSWPRGELTAVVAIAAIGLVAYSIFLNKPGTTPGQTSLRYGAFVSLFGALLMLAGSASRASQVERQRKPPGTI